VAKAKDNTLSTAQIGRCGELLVQYALLLRGIESAPMMTDTGIDLVAYSSKTAIPHTIQVKTNLKAKPGGGRGKSAFDWWIPEDSPAQLVALVDLSTARIWLFRHREVVKVAQQKSSGRLHFYMYTDATARTKDPGRLAHVHQFESYRIENSIRSLTNFTKAGHLDASNNYAERCMRPVAVGRKAFLFVGSERAGHAAAIN